MQTRDDRDIHVLFEDQDLLVVEKPAGLVVHVGTGHSSGLVEQVQRWLVDRNGGRPLPFKVAAAHRLDKETSGIVVLGTSERGIREMGRLFEQGQVRKDYVTLVKGITHKKGRITTPLRSREDVLQEAVTRYRCLATGQGLSLVQVQPETGRMHQIRRHFKGIGHPVGGDGQWGDRRFNRYLTHHGLTRTFLHAAALSFPHPVDGREISVLLPPPLDLMSVLISLDFDVKKLFASLPEV